MVSPKGNGELSDDLDLDESIRIVSLGVISGRIRIASKPIDKRGNLSPLFPSGGLESFNRLKSQEQFVGAHDPSSPGSFASSVFTSSQDDQFCSVLSSSRRVTSEMIPSRRILSEVRNAESRSCCFGGSDSSSCRRTERFIAEVSQTHADLATLEIYFPSSLPRRHLFIHPAQQQIQIIM